MSDAETPDAMPRQPGQPGQPRGGGIRLDLDEEHSRLLLVESAREAAVERSIFVGAVVSEIARISAGSASSARETWSAVLDEIEATTTELLAQQACYRAAGAAIATPVAPSLLAFLS